MLYPNLSRAENGHLTIAGIDSALLAEKYGTPLYIMDEDMIRANCRMYRQAMEQSFGSGALPLYASKAMACTAIYKIIAEEGLGTDVVSSGELYLAKSAGFPMDKVYFHGNCKTEADIRFAIECGIGCIIVDNPAELERVSRIAGDAGIMQKILLRLTPGIDPHTFEAVNTGKVDSKFGMAIETGQAAPFVKAAIDTPNVELLGYHCHIGSQIFDSQPFFDAADIMLAFIAQMRDKYGFTAKVLNLGGGYGVRYVDSDPVIDIAACIAETGEYMKKRCAEFSLEMPQVLMEPGRSIVAASGTTLYTVENVKTVKGFKTYVTIDGGMADNPRYALYQSQYTVLNASRDVADDIKADVVGRCCESGDVIQPDVVLPRPEEGDLVAVLVTGAYNYSMSSGYNCALRPPVVMISGGEDKLAVRRQTLADLVSAEK